MSDLINRVEAQTELQLVARRYTLAHEAHGAGKVVWSDDLISVTDAMNVLREIPSTQTEITRCRDCKYRDEKWRRTSVRWLPCMDVRTGGNWYCGSAERGEQE